VQAKPVLRLSSLSLLQTSPLRFLEAASSNRKKANPANLDPDRTPLLSDRSDSALKPVPATSPAIPPDVVSSHKIEISRWRKQDGVKIPLTYLSQLLAEEKNEERRTALLEAVRNGSAAT
jgi:hypothetical protein